jgi:hypothetical protein
VVVEDSRQEVHYIRAHIAGKSHVHFEGSFSKENCVVVDGKWLETCFPLIDRSALLCPLFLNLVQTPSYFRMLHCQLLTLLEAEALFDISNILDELPKLDVTVS